MNKIALRKPVCSIPILLLIVMISSCAKRENYIYFQEKPVASDTVAAYTPTLKQDDLLDILVSSSDPEASAPFNFPNKLTAVNSTYASGTPTLQGYLIDQEGNINFPVLGKIQVKGKTRPEAVKLIQDQLQAYLNQPIVQIRITNFKITVLGDVSRPGSFNIPNERITLLEALGIAGDLNITGRRQNIKIIRDRDGVKTEIQIDLTKGDLFNSPAFYLEQNDVVYVEPNRTKMNSALYSPVYSIFISATALIITTINLLTR